MGIENDIKVFDTLANHTVTLLDIQTEDFRTTETDAFAIGSFHEDFTSEYRIPLMAKIAHPFVHAELFVRHAGLLNSLYCLRYAAEALFSKSP